MPRGPKPASGRLDVEYVVCQAEDYNVKAVWNARQRGSAPREDERMSIVARMVCLYPASSSRYIIVGTEV